MLADIQKLAKITEQIERRILEFNSLVKKGGLRRKISYLGGGQEGRKDTNVSVHSAYTVLIYANRDVTYKSKVWGTVRWRPKKNKMIDVRKLQGFNAACRQVFDLEAPDPATVWEMLPFTWLIDYFVNVGPVLQALEGSDLVEPYDICLMRERTILSTYTPSSVPAGIQAGRGESKRTYKIRTVHTSSTTNLLHWSFDLSREQVATILALLASWRR